jgi:hypothetical protein
MLPPALAIAWPLWRRHRWGLLATLGYVTMAGAVSALLPARVAMEYRASCCALLLVPFLGAAGYLLAVFSYGFEADVYARESCYPAGLLRLPVPTGPLAGWPMAYGAAAAGLWWLLMARFVLTPWLVHLSVDAEVPLWSPALMPIAVVALLQALLWVPLGLPMLRIILVVVLIGGLFALAGYLLNANTSEGILAGLLGCVAGVSWTIAYLGVKSARHGSLPNWHGLFRPVRQLVQWWPRHRRAFTSTARAQLWFEWRRTGLGLPVLTIALLPLVLFPLLFGKNDVLPTAQTLLGALAIPVFLAGLAGTTVSGKHAWVKDYYGVAPFTATLPLTTARLVSAKLKAAAVSTLATWAFVAILVTMAVAFTGHWDKAAGWWRQGLQTYGPVKMTAGFVAAGTFLGVWTWKRMVDSLCIGLTGRQWIIQCCLVGGMIGFIGVWSTGAYIYMHRATHANFLTVVPWLWGLLVVCRLLATGWAVRRLLRQGLVEARTLRHWLAAWVLVGSALFGVFVWVVPPERVPAYYLALAVLHVMPMAHLAATPLALAWNRHR